MSNLFSIFDPMTSFNYSYNWISLSLFIIILPRLYWMSPPLSSQFWMSFIELVLKEFKALIEEKSYSNLIFFVSVFMIFLFYNFVGLFCYIFTPSSHLSVCLSFSLPLWLSFMIYGWLNNTNKMFVHLVPLGTPYILMPFMVLIESISNIIRPMTLAVRLTANMIAGHLLLCLIGSTGSSLSYIIFFIMIIAQSMLMILEMSVSVIQAYVFSILSVLYSSEC